MIDDYICISYNIYMLYMTYIVSEPIGFLLVHERMLESYVVARDRFLKPNGMMMPTTGSIVLVYL